MVYPIEAVAARFHTTVSRLQRMIDDGQIRDPEAPVFDRELWTPKMIDCAVAILVEEFEREHPPEPPRPLCGF